MNACTNDSSERNILRHVKKKREREGKKRRTIQLDDCNSNVWASTVHDDMKYQLDTFPLS